VSKLTKDPFSEQYNPIDRAEIDSGIEAFLSKGGKVIKMKDSKECAGILRRRDRRQLAADRRKDKENPQGVIGGIPLTSTIDALTVKDED
jgi:hypothetical protein